MPSITRFIYHCRATSRLSSQPVLSSQQLIDNLNCKLNSGFLIPGTHKKLDEFDEAASVESKPSVDEEMPTEDLLNGVNYTNTYQIEEFSVDDLSKSSKNFHTTVTAERRRSVVSLKADKTKGDVEVKKILSKRVSSHAGGAKLATENSETVAINKIPTLSASNTTHGQSKSGRRNSRKASLTTRKNSNFSPRHSYSSAVTTNNSAAGDATPGMGNAYN